MSHLFKYFSICLTVCIFTLLAGLPQAGMSAEQAVSDIAVVEQSDWPREIVTNKGVVVVYQPQPEKLEGNTVTATISDAVTAADIVMARSLNN